MFQNFWRTYIRSCHTWKTRSDIDPKDNTINIHGINIKNHGVIDLSKTKTTAVKKLDFKEMLPKYEKILKRQNLLRMSKCILKSLKTIPKNKNIYDSNTEEGLYQKQN